MGTVHEANRRIQAEALARSWRGQYLISQALTLAIEQMSAVPPPMREDSNIADMQLLRDELFPIYRDVKKAETAYVANLKRYSEDKKGECK